MPKKSKNENPDILRRSLLIGGAAALAMPYIARAQTAGLVRIGVPTKTYFPTIISETAIQQKLFEKEGIKAELTIYRSGAEGFEAIAAGAADLIYNSSMSVAAGLNKGVKVRCVANGALAYYGWYLVAKTESPIQKPVDLAGKKVGITSAGSGTDILALWAEQFHKIKFTRVPLGGGGLVPNLISGNIDASVLYSPLSYQMFIKKQARALIDFGKEVPSHSTGSWIATEKIITERPNELQKALNAIYGGVAWLQADKNRDEVIKFLARVNEIPEDVAAAELDGNIKNLSKTGEFQEDWMQRSLDMAQLIGMTNLAPAKDIYVTKFRPAPTMS
jgi:NitT/TauT family transport system substrate-binding protein